MKLINSVLVLIILVCGSQLSNGLKLDCEFKNVNFGIVGSLYSCVVTSLDNLHNNITIEGYSGYQRANVKAIWIRDTNTKYIPTNLGSFSNITLLMMMNTQLVEIKTKDFYGMQSLEEISLSDNKLSSVSSDVFTTLTKLRFISLSGNQIEELPNGIFVNCLELEKIHLNDNRIKYLGTKIFNGLKKLNYVDLEGNICVDDEYKGTTEITQLKDDIKMNCRNPNENPATTTTTTTSTTKAPTTTSTTQNSMEEKITKLKNELREANEERDALKKELRKAKEQQQTNEDALKKELRKAKEVLQTKEDALTKNFFNNQKKLNELMKQILNAINVQQKDRIEIEKLRIELSEQNKLNQDLLEAKQMNEKIPKMEREIYDLNKNIFDIKEQRRMEQIEVRGKLKRAEEKLASCEKDPAEILIDLRHSRNVNEI